MARKLTLLYAIMCVVAVGLHVAFGGNLGALFAPGPRVGEPVVDIAIGVGVGLLVVLFSRYASANFRWAQRLDADFRELLAPLGPDDAFGIALMSTFAEELLFRGFLQAHLGLVAASLLFGLAHMPRSIHHVPWTLAAIGMGFVFGAMVDARGTLLAPILCHFTINYFNMHALLWQEQEAT